MPSDRITAQPGEERANQHKPSAEMHDSARSDGSLIAPITPGLNARQSAVLRKQQTIGNAAVVRQLGLGGSHAGGASAGAIQRVPETDAESTVQRDAASEVTWTVPAGVTAPLQAAQASAVETEGYAQQLSSSVEMTSAGWAALVGTKLKGSPPAPVVQSGAAARGQLSSVQGSTGKVTGGLDQAKSILSAAVAQGGGDVANENSNDSGN